MARYRLIHTLFITFILSLFTLAVFLFNRHGYGIPRLQHTHEGKNGSGLYLQGHVYNLDPLARVIGIFWLYLGCGDYAIHGRVTRFDPSDCTLPNLPLDFYFDGSDTPNGTYDPKSTHVCPANNKSRLEIPGTAQFETTHSIYWDTQFGYEKLVAYPFDKYDLSTNIRATGPTPNISLPILAIHVYDATDSLSVRVNVDVDTVSHEPDPQTGSYIRSRTVEFTLGRAPLQKFSVFVLFAANWIVALLLACITARALFAKSPVSETTVLFPFSAVGIIPALRALWPGAPAFGEGLFLDRWGTVPQLVIVTVSFLSMIWTKKRRSGMVPAASAVEAPSVSHPQPRDGNAVATRRLRTPASDRGGGEVEEIELSAPGSLRAQ